MISAVNITLSFGGRMLFDEVNISFTKGNCYGIIGANGTGKSTFLKILSGDIIPNKGGVELSPGERIGILRQDHSAYNDDTVLNTVMKGHNTLYDLIHKREALYSKSDFSEEDGLLAAKYEEDFGEMGGYTADSEAASLLSSLGVMEDYHYQLMSDIPGTLKVKILLAQALFGNPDILLLDEPTNDLDIETVEWLEEFLSKYENTVIVVSHDRHFLDAVCTHVADVDRQKIKIYTGNYTFWYETSQLVARQLRDENKKNEDRKKELLDFIARFSANASKSKQATSRKKALEKLVIEDITPSSRKYPGIIFKPERPVGDQILNVENLSARTEDRSLFKNLNFRINKGDKIGFLCKDQMAIHYLFDILNDKAKPEEGKIEFGSTITKAYLPIEHNSYFQEQLSLMDWLRNFVPASVKDVDEVFLRGYLGRMLFSGDEVNKSVKVLSGGEKVRCLLSMMMLQGPNLIILDEPTNHLDLESIQAFNENVMEFQGVVLISSHDHTFMESVCNRVIEILPDGCIDKIIDFDVYYHDETIKEMRRKAWQSYQIN
ncbi:MAG: ATP-binding cassette domain-containing protein [Saprospiraceae bacterium]|nr:ATP-binding cassette domain-containing protein [Candidatus Vicinibacter affinis]MBP6171917.1 ATP-binding cassette domain-containing protein [Saprospiraceae bacterium]MBK6573085.1 ATP-binding cassette domain-containing protein [Candidatus Vicinibacter affinis]MBK6822452.1 ATP-binding cassette domain-containing protein [Candidatus Vicinibacter affinis]MBK7301766.1 ATP-binding cassette domain-containing protein [Candidatus Vicinibacter affinis]